jgi:hypothetical protein
MLPTLFTYTHIPSRREKPHPRLDPAFVKEVLQPRPMSLESPNARSKSITIADGPNTGGVRFTQFSRPRNPRPAAALALTSFFPARFLQALNRHPSQATIFQVGVAEDKGTRRTMEDAHSFVVDFDNIRGQGYFGLFDGHAGKHAAEWCGQHFHEVSTLILGSSPEGLAWCGVVLVPIKIGIGIRQSTGPTAITRSIHLLTRPIVPS